MTPEGAGRTGRRQDPPTCEAGRHEDCPTSASALQVKRMFVLGIDPGLSRCGFGLVKAGTNTDSVDGELHDLTTCARVRSRTSLICSFR